MNSLFSLREVRQSYDGTTVLDIAALEFQAGQMVCLVGPNGAGKSTLLSIMAGLKPGYQGSCLYRGQPVNEWNRRNLARSLCFVPQSVRLEFPFTAEQVVMMGRTPFCDGLFESDADRDAVLQAMEETDTLQFRSRDFRSLSGGERQRVVLASALAQEPEALLLDEPATYLDVKHQLALHRLLRELAQKGVLVVAATHDLNLAAAYSERVVVLHRGRLATDAPPSEALSPEVVRDVFEVSATLLQSPSGNPWIRYDD